MIPSLPLTQLAIEYMSYAISAASVNGLTLPTSRSTFVVAIRPIHTENGRSISTKCPNTLSKSVLGFPITLYGGTIDFGIGILTIELATVTASMPKFCFAQSTTAWFTCCCNSSANWLLVLMYCSAPGLELKAVARHKRL